MIDAEIIAELRRRIDGCDRVILEAVNERLRLVDELWQVKARVGADQIDPGRERRLRVELAAANEGPLTPVGLDELVDELLALVKRELARRASPPRPPRPPS
jgi:chorismate mutase